MSNAMESIKENIEPIRAPNGLYNLGGDDIMAAAAEVLDDISSLTVSAEGSSLSGIREVQTTLPIRKPKKDEFFRTHATAFRGPYSIYELKAQMNTETYFVTPKIWGMFKDDLLKGPGKVVVYASVNGERRAVVPASDHAVRSTVARQRVQRKRPRMRAGRS